MSDAAKPYMARTLGEILETMDEEPLVQSIPFLGYKARVTLLAAREKMGKSTILSAACAAVSQGKPFLGKLSAARKILWVSLEEHPNDIGYRFERMGAHPENVVVVESLVEPFQGIHQAVVDFSPDVVVVDTLPAFAARVGVKDANQSAVWTPIMDFFTSLARANEVAVVLLHHAQKNGDEYRDSSAIGAGVDLVLKMKGKATNPRREVVGVGRWAVEDFVVQFDGTGFSLVENPDETSKALRARARIREILAEKPEVSLNEIGRILASEGVCGITVAKEVAKEVIAEKNVFRPPS